ncbi:unnamed protein product [marine sediment metagenome]|uniref:Uncharacterized protein n=1 Tax=marine sediment metagenome TaxID=412755 RepID=X1K9C0_9ZZZZ
MQEKKVGISQLLNIAGLDIKVPRALGWWNNVDHINHVAPHSFHYLSYQRGTGNHLELGSLG